MIWNYDDPVLGETRVVLKFLWFPRRFRGKARWLEWAYIKEIAECANTGIGTGIIFWEEYQFATEKEYREFTRDSR